MAQSYTPIWDDWLEVTRELNAQEKGRLIDAIVAYKLHGDWQEQIKGNERYVFPTYQVRLDRWNEVSEGRSKAGYIGGKQTQSNESKNKQTEANESKREQVQSNESKTPKVKDKDKDKEEVYYNNNSVRAWITADEITESLERDSKIEEAARTWGLPCNEGQMIKARDMARDYSLDWLLRAIETAGNGKEQTWRYVSGILKSWKENGGPDAKRQTKPVKVVRAQQYEQRDYTEDELLAVSDDLIAEARARRQA